MTTPHSFSPAPPSPPPSPSDNNVLIKYVLFNGTDVDWWASPNTDNSAWLSIGLHLMLDEFDPNVPVDFVVTVRGAVDQLCPAVTYMQTDNVCEYALNGRNGDFQCCPHGITTGQAPPSDCCIDDIKESPYK